MPFLVALSNGGGAEAQLQQWSDAVIRDLGPGPARFDGVGALLGGGSPQEAAPSLSSLWTASGDRSDRVRARALKTQIAPEIDAVLGQLYAGAREQGAAVEAALAGAGAAWQDQSRRDLVLLLTGAAPSNETEAAAFQAARKRLSSPPEAADIGAVVRAGVQWTSIVTASAETLAALPRGLWPEEPVVIGTALGPIWVGSPDHNVGSGAPFLILDPGGDDHWRIEARDGAWTGHQRARAIIDLGGNDTYRSEGPGVSGAVFSVSTTVDYAGDDTHIGTVLDQGGAAFGFAALIDRRGSDRYNASRGAMGFGLWGVGILRDDDGNDHFAGEGLGMGAGASGFGLLIDGGGGDTYTSAGSGGRGAEGFGFGTGLTSEGVPGLGWIFDREDAQDVVVVGARGGAFRGVGLRGGRGARCDAVGGGQVCGDGGRPPVLRAPLPVATLWAAAAGEGPAVESGHHWIRRDGAPALDQLLAATKALGSDAAALWVGAAEAVRAGVIGPAQALTHWVKLRESPDVSLRQAAFVGLLGALPEALTTDAGLRSQLESAARQAADTSEPEQVRAAAYHVLAIVGADGALPTLRSALEHGGTDALWAEAALRSVGPRCEVVALLRAFGSMIDGEHPQRGSIRAALVRRPHDEVDARLPAWLADSSEEARRQLLSALAPRRTEVAIREILRARLAAEPVPALRTTIETLLAKKAS